MTREKSWGDSHNFLKGNYIPFAWERPSRQPVVTEAGARCSRRARAGESRLVLTQLTAALCPIGWLSLCLAAPPCLPKSAIWAKVNTRLVRRPREWRVHSSKPCQYLPAQQAWPAHLQLWKEQRWAPEEKNLALERNETKCTEKFFVCPSQGSGTAADGGKNWRKIGHSSRKEPHYSPTNPPISKASYPHCCVFGEVTYFHFYSFYFSYPPHPLLDKPIPSLWMSSRTIIKALGARRKNLRTNQTNLTFAPQCCCLSLSATTSVGL